LRDIISRPFGFGLASAIFAATVLAAQTPPPQPPSQQPPFRTEANFVRVDVYPTRGGQPVHGLKAEDFEVLEDGVRQQISSFEHVLIAPAGPQSSRREPSSERDMLQQVTNPRSRVFVIFLDMPNVSVSGSHQITEPLIRLMDRMMGPDDLVGIMTPAMSTSNIVFGRKTQVIEEGLRTNWTWGRRFSLLTDEREKAYEACYPPLENKEDTGKTASVLASMMIARKRERATLQALLDLVRYLHAVREERKAVITVTEGWALFRPDQSLMEPRSSPKYREPVPGREVIIVDGHGKLTTKPDREFNPDALSKRECDTDRMALAMMDNELFFREITEDANRGNVSFYPIDPRGLPAFDSPIGPEPPPTAIQDAANLRGRLESMRDLATATDGMAIMGSNDLDVGLRRISDDLTSYYLLGYYSTNTKLDGKFRRLDVRVNQPGVNVRARRGYRAATAEEVEAARAAAEKPAEAPSALMTAMASLARIRPDARFRINAATHVVDGATLVWVAGEVPVTSTRTDQFAAGATADIEVKAGAASQTARVTLEPGERGFVVPLKLPAVDVPHIDVRARLAGEDSTLPFTDAIEAAVGPAGTQPLMFRRGSATGNRFVPAADFRFSRTERLRLELPIAASAKPEPARLLDRTGKALPIPVAISERTDDAGQRWLTADVTLAPLAAADYAVELNTSTSAGTQQVIAAIRVGR
jgi:VWFA-related protein